MTLLHYDFPDTATRAQAKQDLEAGMAALRYRLNLHADALLDLATRMIDHDPVDLYVTVFEVEMAVAKVKVIAEEMRGNLCERDGL